MTQPSALEVRPPHPRLGVMRLLGRELRGTGLWGIHAKGPSSSQHTMAAQCRPRVLSPCNVGGWGQVAQPVGVAGNLFFLQRKVSALSPDTPQQIWSDPAQGRKTPQLCSPPC